LSQKTIRGISTLLTDRRRTAIALSRLSAKDAIEFADTVFRGKHRAVYWGFADPHTWSIIETAPSLIK